MSLVHWLAKLYTDKCVWNCRCFSVQPLKCCVQQHSSLTDDSGYLAATVSTAAQRQCKCISTWSVYHMRSKVTGLPHAVHHFSLEYVSRLPSASCICLAFRTDYDIHLTQLSQITGFYMHTSAMHLHAAAVYTHAYTSSPKTGRQAYSYTEPNMS